MTSLPPPSRPTLSVVVPVYNEEDGISRFHDRTRRVLDSIGASYEFVYVNDGSRDGSLDQLMALCRSSSNVTVVNLSRNFGKEIALSAGLDHARGEAIIVIDADLQDPPELMPHLVAKWREGYDNVYAQRLSRGGETWFKRMTAHYFYRTFNAISGNSIPVDTGDYRLLSRRAVRAISELRERRRFMKGLYGWVGFRQVGVPYHREPRAASVSKWSYWRLWNLSVEGITSFSTLPLRVTTYAGLLVSNIAFFYGVFMIMRTLLFGNPVPGYPSLIVIVLFMGGVQMVALGVIGEYIGRVFDEVKNRPLYLTDFVASATEILSSEPQLKALVADYDEAARV